MKIWQPQREKNRRVFHRKFSDGRS
jgi:hypothetical protein